MPTSSVLEKESLNDKQDKENVLKIEKAAYLVVGSSAKTEEDSSKKKRVLICIELNNKELKVKNYSISKFEKPAGKKIRKLVYSVEGDKAKEYSGIFEQQITEASIDKKNNDEVVANLKECFKDDSTKIIRKFTDYSSMKHAFDEKTGEYKEDIIKRLKSYVDHSTEEFSNLIKVLDNQYSIVLSPEDKSKLKEHMSEMEKILGQAESKNELSLSEKENELISIRDQFYVEIKALSNKYSVQSLNKSALALSEKCDCLIPQGAKFIVGEIIAINKKIETLKGKLEALSKMIITPQVSEVTEENITDLTNKFEEYSNNYADLEKEIKELLEKPEENTQSAADEQDNQIKAAMLGAYSEQIEPALLAIETHKGKTNADKKVILEKIITDIEQLQLDINVSTKEAIQKAQSIVSYIDETHSILAVSRGFFKHEGDSGKLVQPLKLALNRMFLLQEPSSKLSASSVVQPRP